MFKTTEEIQKYLNVVGTLDIDTIKPFVKDAEYKYLRLFLGQSLLKEFQDYTVQAEQTDLKLNALLPLVQNALAAFAFYLAVPSLDIKITDSGFAVVSTNTLAPASAERVKNFRAAVELMGYDRIETMLRFLEENQTDYPTWKDSEAYTQSTRNLINKAEDFYKLIGLEQSTLQFMRMRPQMDNVEMLQIEPVISKALADVLRAYLRGTTIDVNSATSTIAAIQALLIPVRRAVTYLVAGKEIDEKYTPTGLQFLAEVRKLIDAIPANYPEYVASSCYDSTKTSYSSFENTTESQTFVFGG